MFLNGHRSLLTLLAAASIATGFGSTMAQAKDSQFFGRWTVADAEQEFSSRGRLYKTFDIAPCGKDFCGVSVDDSGNCGATLFRFLTIHANNQELEGHGRWGTEKKKLVIDYNKPDDGEAGLLVGLGADDFDFSGREGSMPAYEGSYKQAGDASCSAEALTN
ncbi:MAG: hypothetical protein U1E15_01720 [Hyphomicrobiales bacterium]